MGDMDQGIKRLIQLRPADILALALPGAEYLSAAPTEMATEPQLLLDTLQRVRYQGDECLVDIEAEARPKPDIGRRLYEYGSRASNHSGLTVLSVVLWLEPNGAVVRSPYQMRAGDKLACEWHFTGIEMYRLPAEQVFTSGVVGLLPLIPFTQGGATEPAVEQAAVTIQQQATGSEMQTLEALLAVFGARQLGEATMRSIWEKLRMSTEIIEGSPLYQQWMRIAEEKGMALGREEGREEGHVDALREAARLVLANRFGSLPEDVAQAIALASTERLRDVLAHAGSDPLEQVRGRLNQS